MTNSERTNIDKKHNSTKGLFVASWAGLIASMSSICGKLAVSVQQQTWLCDLIDVMVPYEYGIDKHSLCDTLMIISRICNFILLLILGAVFWTTFAKALVLCSTSAEATVVSTAINFFASGVAGKVLFDETLGLLWFVGSTSIVAGLVLIHQGSREVKQKPS